MIHTRIEILHNDIYLSRVTWQSYGHHFYVYWNN